MAFEAYSVAVRLKLLDSVSSGLSGISGQFLMLGKRVGVAQEQLHGLQKRLETIKSAALIGGTMLGAGIMGLEAFRAPLDAVREYERAFTKFKTLNLGDAVNAQADKFARSANLMGVSATQLMTTMSESVGLLGSFREAQRIAPQIALLNTANANIFHGQVGEIDDKASMALLRFIDRRGLTRDEGGIKHGLDLAEKIVTGSGGLIQFRDLGTFSQQAGTAFRALSDEGLIKMAPLLTEQGGARAGTALMSIYQNLVAGRTPKKTMELLESLGLGRIGETRAGTMGGRAITTTKFSLYDRYAQQLQSDPVGFFQGTVLPLLAKHGITRQPDVLRAINDMLSNRTASNQATVMATQITQLLRDANLTRRAMGAEQVIGTYQQSPDAQWADLMAKYKNLMIELGKDALPMATTAVRVFTNTLDAVRKFADLFPSFTKAVVIAVGALSGLAVIGGAATLAASGLAALKLGIDAIRLSAAAPIVPVSPGTGAAATAAESAAAAGGAANWKYLLGWAGVGLAINDLWNGKIGSLDFNSWSALRNSWQPTAADMSRWQSGNGSSLPGAAAGSPYVRGPVRQQPVQVNSTIHLDGKKIASVVSQHQAQAASQPQTGISLFDPLLAPVPAGGVGMF